MMMHTDDNAVACPICKKAEPSFIRGTEFSKRAELPTQIGVYVCANCAFGFNFPRPKEPYDRYYAAHQNDQLGKDWQISESERKRYQDQIAVLHPYLSEDRRLRVLDFGCGQGGLLETMALAYGQHSYFGCDTNAQARITADGVSIHRDLSDLQGLFDVIVLSHVLEHLIDFEILGRLSKLLHPSGVMYVEVPNAAAYEAYPRREFLYYFDRLHVNHFTFQALGKIADTFSLAPLAFGEQRFGYKDGGWFPAIYGVFTKGAAAPITHADPNLNASLGRYVQAELARLSPIGETLRTAHEVVAYGFGDNFFRSFGQGGPMSGIPLAAVVDQRAAELVHGEYATRYHFLDRETASARFPHAIWVITVSWGGEAIAETLKRLGVQPSHILLL